MAKLHFVDQYTDDWVRLRLGIPTSSQFDKIITPTGKPSKQWKEYAFHLIAERMLGRMIDSYTSPFMERGTELEPDAAEFYELQTGVTTTRIGFVTTDDGNIGCSPDRLIGDDGLLEIKCPMPKTQVKYLLTGEVDKEYWPQLQGQLFVSGRAWVDIIAYHPELPPCIVRAERDVEFIACLDAQLKEFGDFLRLVMEKMSKMVNLSKPRKEYAYDNSEIRF